MTLSIFDTLHQMANEHYYRRYKPLESISLHPTEASELRKELSIHPTYRHTLTTPEFIVLGVRIIVDKDAKPIQEQLNAL